MKVDVLASVVRDPAADRVLARLRGGSRLRRERRTGRILSPACGQQQDGRGNDAGAQGA
ncbi:hypothetical protein OMP40_00875 [Cohnella rhizosphaerae]|uniref:Uncharacterized protein n=1 Tax=Cohnella rhizosphaerae TaxID=1457232 RepID=A0A9X4QS42_9BACL|nr:hypothetical protein [Cohnella rhizosphaerae]MDG0808122.1 hypothetical protein [Cohnella rhizosphaerae]